MYILRRAKKGIFAKDKVKLFVKQTCYRTTLSTDDGYWIVEVNTFLFLDEYSKLL